MRKITFVFTQSLILLICHFLFIHFAFSQKILTIKNQVTFRYPFKNLSCSPDGSRLTFEIQETDLKTSRYFRTIWRTTVSPFSPEKLFPQFSQSFNPRWSPNPARQILAFQGIPVNDSAVADLTPNQLYLFDFSTTEPQVISQAPFGIEKFAWSPNGNSIVYLIRNLASREHLEELRKKQQQKFDAKVYEQPEFKKEIWLFDLQTRISEKIYAGDPGINEIAFGPKGEMLVFSTNYSGVEADANFDLWLLSLGSQQAFQLTSFPGDEGRPQFSPDGQQIAFTGHLESVFQFPQTDLFLMPLTGGAPQNLTADFDLAISSFCWSYTENTIYFTAQEKTEQRIFKASPINGKIEIATKKSMDGWFQQLAVPLRKKQLFCLGETASTLPEIFQLNHWGELKQLSHFSDSLSAFQLIVPEKISWTAPAGKKIEGWFYKPRNTPPPYPTIIALHGGPFGAFKNRLLQNDYLQLIAQHGYAVFAPNPSGSSGYGHAFAREIIHQIGKLDAPQILAGLDYLIQNNLVDSTRLGLVGGSYGGYLVNWLISQSNRFRAAVSLYGIFDLTQDWGTSKHPNWQRIYLGSYFWQNPDLYRNFSPANFVTQIKTPLLLLHGENDRITDSGNSKAAFRALKTLGQEVELVIYPRENHGIQNEPNHEIDKMQRIVEWFDRHLRRK